MLAHRILANFCLIIAFLLKIGRQKKQAEINKKFLIIKKIQKNQIIQKIQKNHMKFASYEE